MHTAALDGERREFRTNARAKLKSSSKTDRHNHLNRNANFNEQFEAYMFNKTSQGYSKILK